jgi:hypothetical protein
MNRWWQIAAIIAVFFIGDRAGGLVMDQLLERSPQRFCRVYAGTFNAEIVCLGNSRGMFTLAAPAITKATGRRAANISYNGMTVQIARAMFADYLAHDRMPKLLVIEASFVSTATDRGLVAEYKPFWNESPGLRALGEKYCPDEARACMLTWLYRYNSELSLRSLFFLARGQGDQSPTMSGAISAKLLEEVEQSASVELNVDAEEMAALKSLVEEARAAGIEVKLVFAPYLPAYADKISNLAAVMQQISAETRTEVVDLTHAISDPNKFADRVHLNSEGVAEVTKLLIERGVFN